MTSGRPPQITRPIRLSTFLPEDVRSQLDIYLFSPIEGVVPRGAYTQFLTQLIREFFANRRIEISDLTGRKYIVSGSPEAIEVIEERLLHV